VRVETMLSGTSSAVRRIKVLGEIGLHVADSVRVECIGELA
jgi:hypothetical protein